MANKKDIYELVKYIIAYLNLNKSYGLNSMADTSIYYGASNKKFLSGYLIDSAYIRMNFMEDSINTSEFKQALKLYQNAKNDSDKIKYRELMSSKILPPSIFSNDSKKLLSYNDLSELTGKIIAPFKWNKKELGFSRKNKKNWYDISVPLYNNNKSKVVIKVAEYCNLPFCGKGEIYLFEIKTGKVTTLLNRYN